MAQIPTPHIEAQEDEIAERVLMAGDPFASRAFQSYKIVFCKNFNLSRLFCIFAGKIIALWN